MITTERENRVKALLKFAFFPVAKVKRSEKEYAVINSETGDVLSNVSERYTVVHNEQIFKPFIDRFGIENIKSFFGYGNRKYYHMKINTGRKFNFGTEEQPDWIHEQIVVENSYNKTRSFRFMFGAFRLICTNGLYSGNAQITFKKIHVGEIPVQAIVDNVINNYEQNSFETWKNLKDKPMTLAEQIKILETFEAFELSEEEQKNKWNINNRIKYTARRWLEKPDSVDNQKNAWGLLNQINRGIATNVRGNSSISRVITANVRAESYLVEKVINAKEEVYATSFFLN